jgi:hypothetical protein
VETGCVLDACEVLQCIEAYYPCGQQCCEWQGGSAFDSNDDILGMELVLSSGGPRLVYNVWFDPGGGPPQPPSIRYRDYAEGVGWSSDTMISMTRFNATLGDIGAAVDSDGNLHATWPSDAADYEIAHSAEPDLLNATDLFQGTLDGSERMAPKLATDGQGVTHMAFRTQLGTWGEYHYVQVPSLTNHSPIATDVSDTAESEDFSIAASEAGAVHIVYEDENEYQLSHAAGFGSNFDVSAVAVGAFVSPSVAIDGSQDPAIAVFNETESELEIYRWNGASFDAETITDGLSGVSVVRLAFDEDGGPKIAYVVAEGGSDYVRFVETAADGSWLTSDASSSLDYLRLDLLLGPGDQVHMIVVDDASGMLRHVLR